MKHLYTITLALAIAVFLFAWFTILFMLGDIT
jgi:hypothetical protein